jgi:hypothetical protein
MVHTGLPLFDLPLSRRLDPVSSFEAAGRLSRSDHWLDQKRDVLNALRRHLWSSSAELAQFASIGRHQTARRLPDLVRDGDARRGPYKVCTARGGRALTWRPVGASDDT